MEDETRIDAESETIIEQTEDDTPLDIAPERRRVKTDKQDTPVETLHAWIKRGQVNLRPDFQRNFVWGGGKASQLIESLLLEIPIPVIYVAEDPNKTLSVVDGQQRLTSIAAYIDGKFPDGRDFKLSKLQVLKELNGKFFRDLDTEMQEAILRATLRLIKITRDSDEQVKFEVFERLNLGAVKLNDQELRNCIYYGPYNELLRRLSENSHMLKVMHSDSPHFRMQDRQLILRFFAMWRKTHLKYKGPMKSFLNAEMKEFRNASTKELDQMEAVFIKSIEMSTAVFGRNVFRRFHPGRPGMQGYWETRKLNVALWDTVLYTFSFFDKPKIIPNADRVREEFLDLLTTDQTFADYISATTDKAERVQYRADVWRKRLQELVGNSEQGPRIFSLELKQRLYDANPTCKICGQRINFLDDSEIDHVKHYWRGGQTIPENARLTHRYCNRARGGRD